MRPFYNKFPPKCAKFELDTRNVIFLFLEVGLTITAQGDLEPTLWPRVTLNLQYSCLQLLRAGITGVRCVAQLERNFSGLRMRFGAIA
jgi:hypothetical protein